MNHRLSSLARAAGADVRFALRSLRRAPRFFVALVLIASLGVGATAAMASLVQATLLKMLPFPDAERLVMMWSTRPDDDRLFVSLPDALEWKQAPSFERLAIVHDWIFGTAIPGVPPGIWSGALVSGDFFQLLGAKPLLGRLLRPEDDALDTPCRAVLSERFFRRHLGSQPGWVGYPIELDGLPCTIVGIAEPGFEFGYPQYRGISIWATLSATWPDYARKARDARDEQAFQVLGKLRPGVLVENGDKELAAIARRISSEHPSHQVGARVTSLQDDDMALVQSRLWWLFAAIGAVFLAACSNIGGLFLVRGQTRRAELALRSALGASQARLASLLLTELALIFVVAAPGAWLAARWFISLFTSITVSGSLASAVAVNERVLLACLLLGCVTGLSFGLGPALALSRGAIGSGLVEAGTGSQGSRQQLRLRASLVVAQIAVACALAATSSTAFRSVAELLRRDGGFDVEGLVTISVNPSRRLYPDPVLVGLYERLLEKLRSRPEIISATLCTGIPLHSLQFDANFQRAGTQPGPPQMPTRFVANLTVPGFFAALKIPLLAGRDFVPQDTQADAPRVAIINETLRTHFFPNEDPLGQRLQHDFMDNTEPVQIIGVAGDVRRFGLQGEPTDEIYMPFGQLYIRTLEVVLRVEPERAQDIAQQLPSWIQEIEPQLPISNGRVQTGGFERSVEPERRLSELLAVFAVACLALAALGTYAAVSYASAQRTREYGLRAALGASPWNIAWLVMAAVLRWLAYGLALALCAVAALGGLSSKHIAGAPPFDLRSFLLAAGVVTLVAVCACLAPALRAIRLTPATALRRE